MSINRVEMNVQEGELFVIEVHEMASTGYFCKAFFDEKKVMLIEKVSLCSKREADFHQEQVIGGARPVRFIFKALQEGDFNIEFYNERPWDKTDRMLLSTTLVHANGCWEPKSMSGPQEERLPGRSSTPKA